jgi:spore coat protein U-like protein
VRVPFFLLIGASIAFFVPSGVVMAATATTTFAVTATVLKFCTVVATPMVFGTYDSTAVVDSTSTITVTCTAGTSYDIGLGAGTGAGATVTTRKMTGTVATTSTLNYFLYRDSGHTLNWGTVIPAETLHKVTGTDPAASTVFGSIPAGQLSTPDAYADLIAVTVTY